MAAADIVASFAGCAGQRCMAAAVLLTIGDQPALLDAVLEKARALKPGQRGGEVGPLIDAASAARATRLVDAAEADGAEILLDGRKGWAPDGAEYGGGHWVGPTIIKFPASMAAHPCLVEELFGPVLAVRVVADANEALKIENADPHGNAACIYTQSGATADWYARRFGAAMVGVNIGVPLPRALLLRRDGGLEVKVRRARHHRRRRPPLLHVDAQGDDQVVDDAERAARRRELRRDDVTRGMCGGGE